MVLGKLPVPGRPTNLDLSRARAICACSRCGWGLFGHFFSRLSFLFLSPSLWETARYRLKYCIKGPLSPKQPTNQIQCRGVLLFWIIVGVRAYCACRRCGWGLLGHFFSHLSFPVSFSLGGGRVVRWCWVNFQCRGVL